MAEPPKKKAAPGQGKAAFESKQKPLVCDVDHISKLRDELQRAGLELCETSGRTQCETLLCVLQYLGSRGINTLEGVGCGYYRIATRIQELEESGWLIMSSREKVVGADGLTHNGIARYSLLGRIGGVALQGSLDFGEVA
ncbi:MAG: hypothetical protein JO002_15890 [Burkholderiaceae bacterium]|nr:hypothetical protein [Burkholderiaceae bacterium]